MIQVIVSNESEVKQFIAPTFKTEAINKVKAAARAARHNGQSPIMPDTPDTQITAIPIDFHSFQGLAMLKTVVAVHPLTARLAEELKALSDYVGQYHHNVDSSGFLASADEALKLYEATKGKS